MRLPAQPAIASPIRVRLIGLALFVIFTVFMLEQRRVVTEGGSYSRFMTFMWPLGVVVGLWFMFEAPRLPVTRPTTVGWCFITIGMVGGVLNFLHMLPLFSP